MRLRLCISLAAAVLVAACAPTVPDSARGVGFDSPQAYQAREAALQGSDPRAPFTVLPPENGTGAPPAVTGVAPVPGSAEATAAETARILSETRATPDVAVSTLPLNTNTSLNNDAGISAENNFDAVSEQRSIEADAARIEQNRAQYQVISPQALPQRSGGDQPNIVAFALSTSHPVGTSVYARAGLDGAARAQRNCARYPSPDQAQIDFLASGGPGRDRQGLDPDGDGYACGWDPAPFRKATSG